MGCKSSSKVTVSWTTCSAHSKTNRPNHLDFFSLGIQRRVLRGCNRWVVMRVDPTLLTERADLDEKQS